MPVEDIGSDSDAAGGPCGRASLRLDKKLRGRQRKTQGRFRKEQEAMQPGGMQQVLAGSGGRQVDGPRPPSWPARIMAALSGTVGAVAGLVPHLVHHIAPIAGAAALTGAAGSALFAALGFVVMVPMLLRLRRRFGSWLAPGIAVLLFAGMFTVSTVWIGPAIRGGNDAPTITEPVHDDHGH